MRRTTLKHGLSAAFAACLLSQSAPACFAAQTEPPALYWYDGTTKMPLYRVTPRRARSDQAPLAARSTTRGDADRANDPVYSTGPDARASHLMRQAPGILFILEDGMDPGRVQIWLAARGLQAEAIAGGAAFKVGSVAGRQALDLANALYESGLVQYAQPNWIVDVDRRSPGREIERAIAEALSPPRQRCAALNAAISQAVTDKRGSRTAEPDMRANRYSGSASPAPGLGDGRFSDKQSRLEAEYSSLGCAQSPL